MAEHPIQNLMNVTMDKIRPVSYTHLDVYKRQVYLSAGHGEQGVGAPEKAGRGTQRHQCVHVGGTVEQALEADVYKRQPRPRPQRAGLPAPFSRGLRSGSTSYLQHAGSFSWHCPP